MNTTRGTVDEMMAALTFASTLFSSISVDSTLFSSISVDSQTKYSSAVRLWSDAMRQVAMNRAPSQIENTVLVLPQSMARSMKRSLC